MKNPKIFDAEQMNKIKYLLKTIELKFSNFT